MANKSIKVVAAVCYGLFLLCWIIYVADLLFFTSGPLGSGGIIKLVVAIALLIVNGFVAFSVFKTRKNG